MAAREDSTGLNVKFSLLLSDCLPRCDCILGDADIYLDDFQLRFLGNASTREEESDATFAGTSA